MKHHAEGAVSSRNALFHSVEPVSLKARCGQGWFLPRAVRERSVPCFSPGCVDGRLLPVSLHIIFSLCVPVSVQISPFSKDTSHIGLAPTLVASFNLITFVKSLSPNNSLTLRYWGFGLQCVSLEGHHPTPNDAWKKRKRRTK